jgi:hypothetical protein
MFEVRFMRKVSEFNFTNQRVFDIDLTDNEDDEEEKEENEEKEEEKEEEEKEEDELSIIDSEDFSVEENYSEADYGFD